MNGLDWAFLPLQRYFDFQGRSSRAEYWWFTLMQAGLSLVTTIIDDLLDLGKGGAPVSSNMLLAFALFIPSLAVAVRRLHDMNRSGWTILSYAGMYGAAVIVGLIASMIFGVLGVVVMCLGLLGVSAGYIFLMATEGNRGDNNYGASPYGYSYASR